jgi:hypothetical protein
MKRRACSMASAFDWATISAKPSISSLVSANGPSVTVNLPASSRTCVPFVGRTRPPVISTTPDLIISCENLPIAAICSGVGGPLLGSDA